MIGKNVFAFISFAFLALYIVITALAGGGNELGALVKYISVLVLIISIPNPKLGFWALILSMGYIDFFKRLMIIGGSFSYLDITYLLAFTPILSLCIFIGVFLKVIFGQGFTKLDIKLLLAWFGASMLLGIVVLTNKGNGLGLLQNAANLLAYIPLIYVVPKIFDNRYEIVKMLKTMIIIFIPVALYAIYQKYVGFADFEIAYLEGGYSSESRIIYSGQDHRYFSTLNSSQNLAKFACLMGVLVLMIPSKLKTINYKTFALHTKIILFVLFFFAGMISGARTGVVMGLFVIPTYYILRSRSLTLISCLVGFLSFSFVISISNVVIEERLLLQASDWIRSHKPDWLPFHENLTTLTIRFEGFSQWSKADFWKPFGHTYLGYDYNLKFPNHDFFTGLMLKLGYIPIFVLIVIGGFVSNKLHKSLFVEGLTDKTKFLSIALALSVIFGLLSAANNLGTYPINNLFYLFIGCAVAISFYERDESDESDDGSDEVQNSYS